MVPGSKPGGTLCFLRNSGGRSPLSGPQAYQPGQYWEWASPSGVLCGFREIPRIPGEGSGASLEPLEGKPIWATLRSGKPIGGSSGGSGRPADALPRPEGAHYQTRK